jgi:hypothetical protein
MGSPGPDVFRGPLYEAFDTEGWRAFSDALAEAMAATWSSYHQAVTIPTVPLVGGSGPPGGPAVGVVGQLAPGGLVVPYTWTALLGEFTSPATDIGKTNQVALVHACGLAVAPLFAAWAAGYTATLTFEGGSLGYSPGPPPALGPWAQGRVQKGIMLGAGTSAGEAGLRSSAISAAMVGTLPPTLVAAGAPTEGLLVALNAMGQAIQEGLAEWKQTAEFADFQVVGTATPPSGAIAPGVATAGRLK